MSNETALHGLSEQERDELISRLIDELPVLRTKLNLSQDDLANILDISRQTYSSIETRRRKMSWSLYLALIMLFDNNSLTHDFLRKSGLFPEIVFRSAGGSIDDLIAASLSSLASKDIRSHLDEKAIHAIETVIMVEYARCNNMSSDVVIKAFEGKRLSQYSENAIKAKRALNEIQAGAENE